MHQILAGQYMQANQPTTKKNPCWPSRFEEDDLNNLTVYQQHVITLIQNSTGNVTLFRGEDQTDRTAVNWQLKQGRKLRMLAPAAAGIVLSPAAEQNQALHSI